MKKLLIIPVLLGTTLFAGINGTASCSNAVAVELNQDITLSPNQNKTYNGNPQKYGYYSFTVAQETEAVISFDTPDDSGTYMALYSNCTSSIASKWSASNTTGMIEKTLPAGTYQFYISKDGNTVKDIKVNIVASTDTVTPPENGGGDADNKALTKHELVQRIKNWAKDPSQENTDAIINANTSKITDMSNLFDSIVLIHNPNDQVYTKHISKYYANLSADARERIRNFNLDVNGWDVSHVTNMSNMFAGPLMYLGGGSVLSRYRCVNVHVNVPIENWDVSHVTDMSRMFACNDTFNRDISNWNVSNVTYSDGFIELDAYVPERFATLEASHNPFKQNTTPPTTGNQLNGAKVCTNATNIAVNQDVTLSPSNDKTYKGAPQKYGYYRFSVADNTQATISFDTPDDSGAYMALYSDNACNTVVASKWSASNTTGTIEKTLPAGTYQFYISKDGSTVKDIKVNIVASTDTVTPPENGGGDTTHKALTRAELDELITAWGKNKSEVNANKIINANTSEITNMRDLFSIIRWNDGYKFNLDISGWDVSHVTNMQEMFKRSFFNQDISSWDVSHVTNMSGMFAGSDFNQDISKWNISNVLDMAGMFGVGYRSYAGLRASKFNQDISGWDVSNVTDHDYFTASGSYMGYIHTNALTDAHNPFKQGVPNGGAEVCTNVTNISLNQDVTLSPSNDKTYNGNPQKFGYYSFSVAENTQATISFDTPDDSGTYMALYSNCTSFVASKWSASNTTGMIEKTLPAGTYQFYISKDGSTVKDIKVNINL